MLTEIKKEYRCLYIFLFTLLLGFAVTACGGFMLLAISMVVLKEKNGKTNDLAKFLNIPLTCLLVPAVCFFLVLNGFSILFPGIIFLWILGYTAVRLSQPVDIEWLVLVMGMLVGVVAGGFFFDYAHIGVHNDYMALFVATHLLLAFGLYELLAKPEGEGVGWLGGCILAFCILIGIM